MILYNYSSKGGFWILNPKGKRINDQRAQYNEFIESELKTGFQWIGQRSQWVKNENKVKKNKFCAKESFIGKVREE